MHAFGDEKTLFERAANGRILYDSEEEQIIAFCLRMSKIGTCTRVSAVSGLANSIIARRTPEVDIETNDPIEPPTVGTTWAHRFLKRHKARLDTETQYPIDITREAASHPVVLDTWFDEYERIIRDYGIGPEDTWNYDETGFRVGCGKGQKVIVESTGIKTGKKRRRRTLPSITNRDYLTVGESVNATGNSTAPFIIIKGVHLMERWFDERIPDGAAITTSDSGYVNDQLAVEFINHLIYNIRHRRRGEWVPLLLDGYDSHCTKPFVDTSDANKIILLCLPPHTSHFLQPLDTVAFGNYKKNYRQSIDRATRSGSLEYGKMDFLIDLKRIRADTFTQAIILASFRKAGIYPINRELTMMVWRN